MLILYDVLSESFLHLLLRLTKNLLTKIKHKKITKVHKSEKEYKICQKQQLMT